MESDDQNLSQNRIFIGKSLTIFSLILFLPFWCTHTYVKWKRKKKRSKQNKLRKLKKQKKNIRGRCRSRRKRGSIHTFANKSNKRNTHTHTYTYTLREKQIVPFCTSLSSGRLSLPLQQAPPLSATHPHTHTPSSPTSSSSQTAVISVFFSIAPIWHR